MDFLNRVMTAQVGQADAMIEKHKINIEVLTKMQVVLQTTPT